MNPCGLTRLLVPAFLVGLAVATFAGNDRYGWIAAGLTVGMLGAARTIRGTNRTCPCSPPGDTDDAADEPSDARRTGLRAR